MKKYTAKQWSELEGGHTMSESNEEKFSFVKDLNESSQYRTRQALSASDARMVADHCFMDTLALWVLYNEFEYAPAAMRYATKTIVYGNFNRYSQAGTDLYHTCHVLLTKDSKIIAGGPKDKVLLDRIRFPDQQMKAYLRNTSSNKTTDAQVRGFFQILERNLLISNSNYRSVRRLVMDWKKLSDSQKSLAITRMLQFYRANARRSELYSMLGQLAKNKGYKIDGAGNAENKKSSTMAKVGAAAAGFAAGAYAGRRFGKGIV
jgi:hypothetical protein